MIKVTGRPSKYIKNKTYKKAETYLQKCADDKETPWVEELALELGVWDTTVVRWAKRYKRFSAVYMRLKNLQKLDLKKKALNKEYVSRVSALLLTAEHDIVPISKREISGGDKPIEVEAKLSPEQEKSIALGIAEVVKESLK